MKTKRPKRDYKNGYLPKVEYWTGKLNEALAALDFDGVARATSKISRFTKKHQELLTEGKMVPGQTGTMVDPDIDPAGGYGLASHI